MLYLKKVSRKSQLINGEKGFSIVETLIAIALLGITAAAFCGAVSTSYRAMFIADERQTAMNLAGHQMEYVKNLGYSTTYNPAPISSEYDGYTAAINTDSITSRDENIQKISVIISHNGVPVLMSADSTLEDFKAIR